MSSPTSPTDSLADKAPDKAPPASRGKTFGVVFLTLFLDILGFGLIIPIQPFYAEHFGASTTVVTWLGASYSLMQFIFAPLWGSLSDRIGRRPVVLVSIAMSVAGFLAFGLAASLPMLFAARMLAGFGNANAGTVQAIVADVTTSADRAKGMGLIGAAFGLGFIFGPAVGGYTSQFGANVPAFISAALGLLNLVLAYFLLPETHPRKLAERAGTLDAANASGKAGGHSAAHKRISFDVIRQAARFENVRSLFILYLAVTAAFSLMETALSLFIENRFVPKTILSASEAAGAAAKAAGQAAHLSEAAMYTANVLLVVGIASAVVQGGLISKLTKTLGESKLIVVGISILSLTFFWMPFISTYAWIFPAGILLAIGSGVNQPSLSSLLSRSVDSEMQGSILGTGQSLSALGRVLGPLVSGYLFSLDDGLPFQVGGLVLLLCLIVALTLKQPEKAA